MFQWHLLIFAWIFVAFLCAGAGWVLGCEIMRAILTAFRRRPDVRPGTG